MSRRDEYEASGQNPNFNLNKPPHLHSVLNAPVEFRNRELLEYVYYLLRNNTPGQVVAEIMSTLFWSHDNTSEIVHNEYLEKKIAELENKDEVIK